MRVIPVLDIQGGVVVRAVAGDRANYQPIVSPLFQGSNPLAAAAGLMAAHAFDVIYIADLDAIEGRGDNSTMIGSLVSAYPAVEIWIDSGARTLSALRASAFAPQIVPVVGSETGITAAEFIGASGDFGDRLILSLDFRPQGFVGHLSLLEAPESWPDRVIAMTLGRVGTGSGPDIAVISDIVAHHSQSAVYAAGGVRNLADLRDVERTGAKGALISSALHAQTITADDLTEIASR